MVEVSVIIPNYNHSKFLDQRFHSVFNQSFENYEVILLDDASTDDSLQILNEYKNHPKVSQSVINRENSGSPFKQWQKGMELAKGNFIWIAESDDYCDVDFLKQMIVKLKKGTDLCYSQSIDVNKNGEDFSNRIEYTNEFEPNIWEDDFSIDGKTFVKGYLSHKNVIPNASAVVFKKELIDKNIINSDILSMSFCGDWLFWIKLCSKAEVSFVSKPLNYFRFHQNVSRVKQNIERKKKRILEEIVCRNYLKKELSISNKKKHSELLKQWIKLHSKKEIFQKSYYKFNLKGFSKLYLFYFYFITKIWSRC